MTITIPSYTMTPACSYTGTSVITISGLANSAWSFDGASTLTIDTTDQTKAGTYTVLVTMTYSDTPATVDT